MLPSYRLLKFGLALLAAAGLFMLTTVSPLAQSSQANQQATPKTHISDPAGIVDPKMRTQLEGLLANLKDKTQIQLYVAVVEGTGGQAVADFSQRLANEWNIGSKNSRSKSLLLVVSAESKSSFTQFSRSVQGQLPDGVLGEMSYRMRTPLSEGRFSEAIDGGIRLFVNSLAEKIGFNAAELEPGVTSPVVADGTVSATQSSPTEPVLISAREAEKTRPRVVREAAKAQDPQPTPPGETPKTEPSPEATPEQSPEPTPDGPKREPTPEPTPEPKPAETPSPEASPAESPKPSPRRVKR